MPKIKDRTNERFGRLVVIERLVAYIREGARCTDTNIAAES